MWLDLLPFLLRYALGQRSPSVSLRHVVIHSQVFLAFGLHWAGEHRIRAPVHTPALIILGGANLHWELFPWLSDWTPPVTSTAKRGKSVPGNDWAGLAAWGTELHPTHYPGKPLCLSPLTHEQYLGGGILQDSCWALGVLCSPQQAG